MFPLALCLFPHTLAAPAQHVLPPGAVARLGTDTFRFPCGGNRVKYSPDGKRVAVTSPYGVFVWDVATGKRLLRVPCTDDTAFSLLSFHPDGDVFVTTPAKVTGESGVSRIDPETGKVRSEFYPSGKHTFRAVSPNGSLVFSHTEEGHEKRIVASDLATGKEVWRTKPTELCVMCVSSDGSRLVAWSFLSKWRAEVFDTATGKSVGTFANADGYYPTWTGGGIAVGARAEVVICSHSWGNGFSVFNLGTEKPAWTGEGSWYENGFLTKDGKRAVMVRGSRGDGDTIEVWDLATKKCLSSAKARTGWKMALSPDGKTLAAASASGPGTLCFIDVATGKPSPRAPAPFTQSGVVWYLSDGTLASSDATFTNPVKWDVKTGVPTPLPAGTKPPSLPNKPGPNFKPPAESRGFIVSPDGKRVLGFRYDPDGTEAFPGDNYYGLFDDRGAVIGQYSHEFKWEGPIRPFSADGKMFAIPLDSTITVYDSSTGATLQTFKHDGRWVDTLAFSPDGRFLATTCDDGTILVWDVSGVSGKGKK
jgi:WD40 repeat protein